MDDALYKLHYEQEESHWWFAARSVIVRAIIEKYGNLNAGDTVLDIGCGTGAIMKRLSEKYRMVGIDTSALAIEYARKRGLTDLHQMYVQDFPLDRYDVRAALLLDVIEHIDDAASVLQAARRIVGPKGRVIITVPANQWMWSTHDVINHHKRRYNARTLRQALKESGLRPVKFTYYNTLLFPAAALHRLLIKEKNTQDTTDALDQPSGFTNTVLRTVFSLERFIVPYLHLPYGVSLLAVAEPMPE